MRSISFPDMFSRTVTKTVQDYDATLQNLKMLLWSEKGELFGDPYFGTGLKKYLLDFDLLFLKNGSGEAVQPPSRSEEAEVRVISS